MWRSTRKSPGVREDRRPGQQEDHKTIPGADFFAAYPFSKTLGASVSLFSSNQIGENPPRPADMAAHAQNFDRRPIADPNASSRTLPARRSDSTRPTSAVLPHRLAPGNLQVRRQPQGRWRPTPSQTLSTTLGYSTYTSVNADRRIQYAAGTAQDWGPTFTHSYQFVPAAASQKRGAVEPRHVRRDDDHGSRHGGRPRTPPSTTGSGAAHGRSRPSQHFVFSKSSFPDTQNGHLSGLDINLPQHAGRGMNFDGINDSSPAGSRSRARRAPWSTTTSLRSGR